MTDTAPNGSKLGAESPQVLPVDLTRLALDLPTRRGKCRADATECASCCLRKRKPSSTCLYPRQVSVSRSVWTVLSLSRSSPTERRALQYLVVSIRLDVEMSGAATECTTICHLLRPALLVTAGWEALRTMYPHFGGVDFLRKDRQRSLAANDRGAR